MKITLNGKKRDCDLKKISYEDVLCMAEQPTGATVVYHVKGGGRSGSLYAGKAPIDVEEGLIIDCVVTGDA